jgi:hypothetical protein
MIENTHFPERKASNPMKIVCHSRTALSYALKAGWFAGASYTNLRDIRGLDNIGFIDIDWKNYDFQRHLLAVKRFRPLITIANDVVCSSNLNRTLDQAYALLEWSHSVVIVPKDPKLGPDLRDIIPEDFILGYSVPTRYGSTSIPTEHFSGRPVHLLGGRPDVQRKLGDLMPVCSLDVNRFTFDAKFGDFFDGERFRPHPVGGYHRCLQDSIRNIDRLWEDYEYCERLDKNYRS